MRYPDSVEFLYSLGNEIRTVKFGLDAIRTVLDELGNPQDSFRVVHVAGTNGKGSTCAMIESGLRAAGFHTGLYTSPHLAEPTERVQISGASVSRASFTEAFGSVHEVNELLISRGVLEHHTTYFETVTAMGFLLMREARVEIAVVEVGLGGRLDATNIVQPELCVITPIDFDHEVFLGNSLEAIAGEKAGILKPGVPAVFAVQRPEAEAVLADRSAQLGIEVVRTSQYRVENLRVGSRDSEFDVDRAEAHSRLKPTPLVHVHCPLAGRHQVGNALTAVAALERLGISPHGIATARWPGRLETICERPHILLDGAHNPAGARALAEHVREFYAEKRLTLIYGAMRDKSVEEITEILFPLADEVILTAPASPRAVRPEALLASSEHPSMRVVETAAEALAIARACDPEDLVVITGSLYLVGEVRALLQ